MEEKMTLNQAADIQKAALVRKNPVLASMNRQIQLYEVISEAEFEDDSKGHPLDFRFRDLIPGYGLLSKAGHIGEFMASKRNLLHGAIFTAYHGLLLNDFYQMLRFLA